MYLYVHMVFECTENGYSISSPATPKLLIPTKLLAEKPTDLPVSCQT